MKSVFIALSLFGTAAFAQDVIIPPIAQCNAVDTRGQSFTGAGNLTVVKCQLFGKEENMGCEKIMGAVNDAMATCQANGKGACQIDRCWENPQ